jgi:hypothetical protein
MKKKLLQQKNRKNMKYNKSSAAAKSFSRKKVLLSHPNKRHKQPLLIKQERRDRSRSKSIFSGARFKGRKQVFFSFVALSRA